MGRGGGGWWEVQGRCERRLEVFGKFHKKKNWGVGAVGRGGGQVGGSGWWGGGQVDVNAMLGVGGDVGYGGCERRIEGIVQCT